MEHPTTHDAFPLLEHNDTVSSATAYPGSVEEVQAIMVWANKHEFPVFPISIGRNIGYGGAGPRVRGSLTIDMGKRMNKILKLDESTCSCIVEPGVTYFALYEAIQQTSANLMMDCPDLGGGSLIGNICERGMGFVNPSYVL
jgi:FAD/FMN-containing dehydrogenase